MKTKQNPVKATEPKAATTPLLSETVSFEIPRRFKVYGFNDHEDVIDVSDETDFDYLMQFVLQGVAIVCQRVNVPERWQKEVFTETGKNPTKSEIANHKIVLARKKLTEIVEFRFEANQSGEHLTPRIKAERELLTSKYITELHKKKTDAEERARKKDGWYHYYLAYLIVKSGKKEIPESEVRAYLAERQDAINIAIQGLLDYNLEVETKKAAISKASGF